MNNITFYDMDDFIIRKIYDIIYEDYDIRTIINLSRLSSRFNRIGKEYTLKYLMRNENNFFIKN